MVYVAGKNLKLQGPDFFFFANLRLLIKTPKVLEVARRHFACSTLEGVELEDDGGSG